MREPEDNPRPIWRRWVAAALAGWMALAVGALVGAWRLVEVLPAGAAPGMAVLLFVVAPVILLVWAFWTMLRDPVTGWIAPSALLAFAGAMIPAWQPLLDAGMQLNFAAHRPTYDVIVAEAQARRIMPEPGGWVRGERDGVRYRYRADRPGVIEFLWVREPFFEAGVRYNDIPCRPTLRLRCLDRGRPLQGHYFHYWFIA